MPNGDSKIIIDRGNKRLIYINHSLGGGRYVWVTFYGDLGWLDEDGNVYNEYGDLTGGPEYDKRDRERRGKEWTVGPSDWERAHEIALLKDKLKPRYLRTYGYGKTIVRLIYGSSGSHGNGNGDGDGDEYGTTLFKPIEREETEDFPDFIDKFTKDQMLWLLKSYKGIIDRYMHHNDKKEEKDKEEWAYPLFMGVGGPIILTKYYGSLKTTGEPDVDEIIWSRDDEEIRKNYKFAGFIHSHNKKSIISPKDLKAFIEYILNHIYDENFIKKGAIFILVVNGHVLTFQANDLDKIEEWIKKYGSIDNLIWDFRSQCYIGNADNIQDEEEWKAFLILMEAFFKDSGFTLYDNKEEEVKDP
jgi:hypothetical protein